ncbi:MAG: ATP phosphoribosyltransferase [Chloroflexota bacterium]|nr:ATP phosphoribosyltransferase [Chloroflexota bacterium]
MSLHRAKQTRTSLAVAEPSGDGAGTLRLAMQRSGRLTEETVSLLHSIGLSFENYGQRLFSDCRNFPLSLLYGRDDDIPEYVASGTVDLGIVGQNLLHEEGVAVAELLPLGFGYCKLVLAVPKESTISAATDLAGARIATSYPQSAARFFAAQGIAVEIVTLSGSVEVAPALGLADAIVELTATGSTLVLHDLRTMQTILESQAVLVANPAVLDDPAKRVTVDRLLLRLRATQAARLHKYVMMNAPRAALPVIQQLTPGLKSPTIVPLSDPDWVAVHTVIKEDEFWAIIEALRAAGATEILVTPIEKLLI